MPIVPTTRGMLTANRAVRIAASTARDLSSGEQPVAFIADTTGSVIGTLWGDNVDVSIPVVAGVMYPISLKSIDATNAVALHIFYN